MSRLGVCEECGYTTPYAELRQNAGMVCHDCAAEWEDSHDLDAYQLDESDCHSDADPGL